MRPKGATTHTTQNERQQGESYDLKREETLVGRKPTGWRIEVPFSLLNIFSLPSRLLLRGLSEGEFARAKEREKERKVKQKGSIKNKLGKHKRVCAGGNTRALKLPPFLSLRTRAYRYDARGRV